MAGLVLSSLYTPLHVAVFHALSSAHRYNVSVHCVVYVIVFQLVKLVPLETQSLAFVREYFE